MALLYIRLGILAAVVAMFAFAGVIAYYSAIKPGLRSVVTGIGVVAAGLYGASLVATIIIKTVRITVGP